MIHSKKPFRIAALSCLVAASLTSCAQQAPPTGGANVTSFEQTVWETHTRSAAEALEAKDYDKAEKLYNFAIQEAEKLGEGDPQLAASYNNMADFYFAQGDGEKAENMYSKSLAIKEKSLGLSDRDLVVDLTGLGNAYAAQEKYEEADASFKRALDILDANSEDLSSQFVSAYADILRKQDKEEDARKLEARLKEKPAQKES